MELVLLFLEVAFFKGVWAEQAACNGSVPGKGPKTKKGDFFARVNSRCYGPKKKTAKGSEREKL